MKLEKKKKKIKISKKIAYISLIVLLIVIILTIIYGIMIRQESKESVAEHHGQTSLHS